MSTKIERTDETWNPIIGCSKLSQDCKKWEWNGKTYFVESALEKPLHWKKPRKISVCSMGDLFHESVPFEWIDKVMAIILTENHFLHRKNKECCFNKHIFQILTKKPGRMNNYINEFYTKRYNAVVSIISNKYNPDFVLGSESCKCNYFPLDNLWLGVTCENQQRADERIPLLLQTPATIRFVSCEPLLSDINLSRISFGQIESRYGGESPVFYNSLESYKGHNGLDWVIVGGETGHNARPIRPDWVRNIKDQCKAAGVPFFFKSWGEWACGYRIGKKHTGNKIDGVEYKEFPKAIWRKELIK